MPSATRTIMPLETKISKKRRHLFGCNNIYSDEDKFRTTLRNYLSQAAVVLNVQLRSGNLIILFWRGG